jgi:hypothetical protein
VRKKVRATCIVIVLGPLPPALEVCDRGAGHAHVVDAAVLIEPVILGRQDRRLHDLRHVLDLHDGALFLAEFADQLALGAIDPQRDLRTVIG